MRLEVPRLSGHSAQDTQTYKSEDEIKSERARDPLPKLKSYLVPRHMSKDAWEALETQAEACLLYTSPSPRDQRGSRMPSSA